MQKYDNSFINNLDVDMIAKSFTRIGKICVDKLFYEKLDHSNNLAAFNKSGLIIECECSSEPNRKISSFNETQYKSFSHKMINKMYLTYTCHIKSDHRSYYNIIKFSYCFFLSCIFRKIFSISDSLLFSIEYISGLEDESEELASLCDSIVSKVYMEILHSYDKLLMFLIGVDTNFFHVLSYSEYEKRSCNNMIIAFVSNDNIDNISDLQCFENTIEFKKTSLRNIRKLLEIVNFNNTNDNHAFLVVNLTTKKIVGISKCCSEYDYLCIIRKNSWELMANNEIIIKYQRHAFRWMSTNLRAYGLTDNVCDIVEHVNKYCNHGALMIFFPNSSLANNQAELYSKLNKGYKFLKKITKKEDIIRYCNIDGAVFIDKDGNCYGYGIIVNGNSNVEGDISRGSRYNAAREYVNSFDDISPLAVVISEDGGITFQCKKDCVLINNPEIFCENCSKVIFC